MASPRYSRPPNGFGRVSSMASTMSSSHRSNREPERSSTMSTVSNSVYVSAESPRSNFQDQLLEMARASQIPLTLQPLLTLPSQRATPPHASDKSGAEQFLMSLRPKRVLLGKKTGGFGRDEVLLALDKAIGGKPSVPIIEALLQLAETDGVSAANSSTTFTTDKKGHAIPTLEYIFGRAEQSQPVDIWKLFLGRVSQRSLDSSLAITLKDRVEDTKRIKFLLEYGANPELCQDRLFELIASGSEDLVELLLLSPLLKNGDFLSQGLVKAASSNSIRNVSMLLLRGADANYDQASALRMAISAKKYALALAMVTLAKNPVFSSYLDDLTSLISAWDKDTQKPFIKMLLFSGASGPRTSKAVVLFIAPDEEDITTILLDCHAFRHSTFPAPKLFQFAVDSRDFTLALKVLRSSNNRSFSDYAGTGAHLQLVKDYCASPEGIREIISELLSLGISGDFTSQMLTGCCAAEQINGPHAIALIGLLINTAAASPSYSDGAALFLAIDAANIAVIDALISAKPTKKILISAVSYASTRLRDENPSKLEIWSLLLDAGASGVTIDQELISAVDVGPHAFEKVKVLLKKASVDHAEGKAVIKAVKLERPDLLEAMLAHKAPQSLTMTSIWKQTRKLFALAESSSEHLPYNLPYMLKIYVMYHRHAKNYTPLNDLLLDATQCASKDVALAMAKIFLSWGASPNHALGTPLQACIKRSDKTTLKTLLEVEVSKTSLKYAFTEALLLRQNARHAILEMIIDAGLEKASLHAALPQVLREDDYDISTVHLLVESGARLYSSFGQNLVPPSVNLDVEVVEQRLSSVNDKDPLLIPMKAVLNSHTDWQSPDGTSLAMLKLLVKHCRAGPWADTYFIAAIKLLNQYSARIFENHLTTETLFSDALQELLANKFQSRSRERLSTAQYLLRHGAKGNVIDETFVHAARVLDYEWVSSLYPYLSDRSVALSAFDLVVNGKGSGTTLQGNRLEIVHFLLGQGLQGSIVDDAFVEAVSTADLKSMNNFLAFISSKDVISESLSLLAQREDILISRDGLAIIEILLSKGPSDLSTASVAWTAARARSLNGVKLVTAASSEPSVTHSAFQGLMEYTQPLESSDSRNILFHLLETNLGAEDIEHVVRLAATTYDITIFKKLASLKNFGYLHDHAIDIIALSGDTWLCSKGLEVVKYLLNRSFPLSSLHRLIEAASKALHLSALQMLLHACDDNFEAVELAFSAVVSNNQHWSTSEGLRIVGFLLNYGPKGPAVEEAAAYAAQKSNYDALNMFLKSPAAAIAIPAAFKALTRSKSGQLSPEQLTIAGSLVEEGVSTEILAIAAIEMAKLLDIEGLRVLSRSLRFRLVADDVLREIFISDHLWRTPAGHRMIAFLLEGGISTKMIEESASKAAASLEIDLLRTILESNSSETVVDSAFASMTGLERGWLCPEGLRITGYLLKKKPSKPCINKAFVQAGQYLHYDAAKVLSPNVADITVLNEALYRAVNSKFSWLSELHLVKLLLESGAEGDAVEFALIEGARKLNYASLELLAPKIDRVEVYSKAFAAATEESQHWRSYPNLVNFLLEHGATGEPVENAYVSASKALDLQTLVLLNPYILNPDTHNHAFLAATSTQSWLSPGCLDLLQFLHTNLPSDEALEVALVSAAKNVNLPAVELLSSNATEDMCSKAFAAATCDVERWTSIDGSKVVNILTQKGARGGAVGEALISSAGLFRLDLVRVLAQNIDNETVGSVSLAFDALLSTDSLELSNSSKTWLSSPDAIEILQILINMGGKAELAHDAFVRAAQVGNKGAVDILAQTVDDPLTFTHAFNAMTDSRTLWLENDYFDLVATLLSRGAAGEGVNIALISALEYAIEQVVYSEMLELLLAHEADVNFDHGKSLQLAAHHARADLLKMLLQKNPDSHSLYMCLKAALNNYHDEEVVVQIFGLVIENESLDFIPNVNTYTDLDLPLIFYSLNNYPASALLAKDICAFNADLSTTIDWDLYEDEYGDPVSDRLSPLLVSLDKNCSDEVVDVLLAHGAQVNFISEQSRVTALMLAAGKGRSSVVSTLIDRGASVIQKDSRNRTSLCYAARHGDISVIKSILKKNPSRNDGSLHEASRELHADAVQLLVNAGHDINFPSSKHEGRSPLCELCCACKGSKDLLGLQETLTALAAAKAEPLRKCRGRTALFMAMENANPSPVVTALIEVCLWRDLNDPQNVYEEGDYFYSATMYIKKGIIGQPEATAMEILEKLHEFSATDRYYAKERMPQPRDAIGMPQRILDLDHKKWIRSTRLEEEEEDFERKLKRADQEVANRQLLSQRQHLMLMEQRENLAQQQSTHTLDTHLLSTKLRDREHGLGLVHQEEIYDRRLGEMAAANAMKLNIEAAQHETKIGIQQQNRDAQLIFDSLTQEQKLAYLNREQDMRYSSLEAQQNLKIEGITTELDLKFQQQEQDLGFKAARSSVDRADLNHKLQYMHQINTGRVQMNQQLGELEMSSRQNRNLLEDENRQSQRQHQIATDERKINTQSAMNQHEYARNQDAINTRRIQGRIELDKHAGLSQIEQEMMHNKFRMTQYDREHRLENEDRMGQIQNRNLADKYQLTREDRQHQLQTERKKGLIENQNLQEKLSTNLNYLQSTHREKLGFQQATDQQKLGFQQNFDRQKLQTLHTEGRIQNNTLQTKNNINLNHQHRMGNARLGEQAKSRQIDQNHQYQMGNMRLQEQTQSKRTELNFQQYRLGQQAQSASIETQKQGYLHENRMGEYAAQDHLNTRKVQGAILTQQAQSFGNSARNVDNSQYRALEDS